MRLTLAGRRSPMREAARPARSPYACPKAHDGAAAALAFGAILAACLVLVLVAVPFQA